MYGLTRYVFRQLAGPLVLITLALTVAVWITHALRVVDLIAANRLSAETFLSMSLAMMPSVFTLILPIALFCAILHSVSRLIQDHELMVMWAAGLSRWTVIRPVLALTVVVTAIIYGINFHIPTPAAQDTALFESADGYGAILIREGEFKAPFQNLTIHADTRDSEGAFRDLIVHDTRDPRNATTWIAERGFLARSDSGPVLELRRGTRQDLVAAEAAEDWRLKEQGFDRFTLHLADYLAAREPTWFNPQKRFVHEMLFKAGPVGGRGPGRVSHKMLSAPLYAVSFAVIAIITLLAGHFTRGRLGGRIVLAAVIALGLRVIGVWLEGLTLTLPELWPWLYGVALAPVGVAMILLVRPRRFRRSPPPPADLNPTIWPKVQP